MVSAFTHAFSAIAIGTAFPASKLPRRTWLAGALLAAAPDLDAVLHWSGVPYDNVFGHRGFTHSPFFALLVAAAVAWLVHRRPNPRGSPRALFAYLFLCVASHGLLDAMTNGGLGVAFLAPFSAERWFLPWTPIAVAPISVRGFFTERGLEVFQSELRWVWLPCAALIAAATLAHVGAARRSAPA